MTRESNPDEKAQPSDLEITRLREALEARTAEVRRLERELAESDRGLIALYAELDDKTLALQRASELKTRFLSNMSHEFRTPVNSILTLTRILLDRLDGDLTPEQEKQVTFVRKSAQALSELVNDLLDLAKIEAGKVTVRAGVFDVAELLGGLRGAFRPLVSSESVSLIVEDPEGLKPMYSDEGKVAQILRNFISNALKFTEKGEVRVAARPGPDDTVVFSVTDTGIGIAPQDQELIFEEFTQIEGPVQKRVKGTGLGLPLTRKLVELLGGSIRLHSEPGVGSTFIATLPRVCLNAVPDPGEAIEPARRRAPRQRLPVLIVEDDTDTLRLYDDYFRETHFQCIAARSLPEARRVLQALRPAAVVLDVLLDGDTAWSLLLELKRDRRTHDIPVLVTTLVDGEQMALALGANDFCLKPVQREWLLGRLERLALRGGGGKLLLIDDDEVSRYVLKGLLSETGYTLLEATCGREGLRMAIEEQPQLIFLDLIMPDLTGFEVLNRLKAEPTLREVPVVVVTSQDLDEEERRRLTGGATAILPKDVLSREVAVVKIREALLKAGLNPGLPAGEGMHD